MTQQAIALSRDFYARPAIDSVREYLGKTLVHNTDLGRVAGIVYDVEAYPAFVDQVNHGNKRTRRAEVLWGPPGYAYVYLIYGKWFQFAAVVNSEDVPDVVFIRAVLPQLGLDIMARQWDRPIAEADLCGSPGKMCRSMRITKDRYGVDLCGSELYFEDHGIVVPSELVRSAKRVGINPSLSGHDKPLRFYLTPRDARKLPTIAGDDPTQVLRSATPELT